MNTKRILAIFVAVGMLAGSNAFASRARVTVMGGGDAGSILNTSGAEGSMYVDDAYNMFYNPAYINDYKNWVTLEKSATGTNTGSNNAMGGFVTGMGPVNVGVYMNRVGSQKFSTGNNPVRPIDVTVGGDMGVKWGLGLTYASYYKSKTPGATNSDDEISNAPLTIRAGVSVMGFDPWINFQTDSKDNAGTTAGNDGSEAKRLAAGLKYHFGEWTPYFAVKLDTTKSFAGTSTAVTSSEVASKHFGLGVARNFAFSETVRLNYALSFWRKLSGQFTVQNSLPIDVSVEADATSWLTVRAGVHYSLYDRTTSSAVGGGTASTADDTTTRLGGTFKLGKVDMDFGVGTNQNAAGSGLDGDSFGFSSNIFANAALTYHW